MKFTKQQKQRYERIKTIEQMQEMDPVDFEQFVGWLYQNDGYSVSDTVVTGDEGIDLTLKKRGRKTVVQCKRYSGTVGQPTVRDLYGAMFHVGAQEAHLVTTGKLSRQGEAWAAGKPINLVDGHDLVSWVNKNRRDSQERQGSWIIWATAGTVVAVLALCVVIVGGAYWFMQQRTNLDDPIIVEVPTRVGEDEEVDDGDDEPVLAPTVTLAAVNNPSEVNVRAIRLDNVPVIDGNLDEWRGYTSATQSNFLVYRQDEWDETRDLTAEWWLGWDETNLYMAVNVIDDQHVQTQTGRLTYLGDSVDMQIDTDRAGDRQNTLVNFDDFQLAFSAGDFAGLPAEAYRFRGNSEGGMVDATGHNISVAAVQHEQGYRLEAAIPWRDLDVIPEPNMILGLNLNANDNDTPGTAAQEVMMSNVSTRTFRNPTTWGEVTLAP